MYFRQYTALIEPVLTYLLPFVMIFSSQAASYIRCALMISRNVQYRCDLAGVFLWTFMARVSHCPVRNLCGSVSDLFQTFCT